VRKKNLECGKPTGNPLTSKATMQNTDSSVFVKEKRIYKRGDVRRSEIMDALVSLLGEPTQTRFSTAEIAVKARVSEAGIYRHFSGKAAIIEAVLKRSSELVEKTLRSADAYPGVSMLERAYIKLHWLLMFAWKNPGLTRLLTGEALIYEERSLAEEKEKILLGIQNSIRNTLALAVVNREIPKNVDTEARARFMVDYVLAQWLRYSQSGFKSNPTATLEKAGPSLFGFPS
jgi:TetR/AcrR family transcriptional regulator